MQIEVSEPELNFFWLGDVANIRHKFLVEEFGLLVISISGK